MRTLAVTLLLSSIFGLIAFGSVFLWNKHQIDEHHAHMSAFDWFCEEFDIADQERKKIETLHIAYFPECEDHCVHYADTKETLAHIVNDPELNKYPEHAEAARKMALLEQEADKKFIDFIYSVAAEMDETRSQEYLQRMKGWLQKSSVLVKK